MSRRPIPLPDGVTLAELRKRIAGRYVVTPDGCWNFTGSIDANGRPRVWIAGREFYAYRVSYTALVGPIPDGLQINHHCDNPRCIRPNHLYAGDQAQNNRDTTERGRWNPNPLRGAAHPNAKLTEELVVEIARRYATGDGTQASLAAEYGVEASVVGAIVRGKRWKHVDVPVTLRGVGWRASIQPCGTRAGYGTHLRRGEPSCAECLEANRIYMLAYKRARRATA